MDGGQAMRRFAGSLLAGCIVIAAGACCAQEGIGREELFASGNNYYEAGEYEKAVESYSGIVRSGESSAAVYYNLAGAYFKMGDLGRAILNYERALNMDPRDADIKANYRFAKSMITGKPVPDKGFWSWRPVKLYSKEFTVNEMIIMTSAAFFVLFTVCAAVVISKRAKRSLISLAAVIGVFIILSSMVISNKIGQMNSYAVVVAPQAEALFGPFYTATKFFTLYEGNDVRVLSEKDDWYKVRRSDGKTGWVKSSGVERIRAER
jgi:tetratricopeptide (TPR) repeat protein